MMRAMLSRVGLNELLDFVRCKSYLFFFDGFAEFPNTEPAKLLMPLGALVRRTLPETLFTVLKLESALLSFVFMLGSLAIKPP
jgi:hypothetical protein